MAMKLSMLVGASLLFAVPASTQGVAAGIEQWQKGEHQAAVAVWAPLAAKGDPDAAFNLGQAYRLGKGVGIDLAKAQSLYEQAARRNHVDAATTLGLLLFQNGNRTGAMRWLRQAAEAGEPRAMLIYGTALFNGDGVARDPVRAYAYVSRATAQGMGAARETLLELDENLPLEQRQKGVELAKTMVGYQMASPPAPKVAAKAVGSPVVASNSPKTTTPAPTAETSGREGGWRIQLGAFGQRAAAEGLFAKIRGKLGAREAFYIPAGKVTRLQVGPYSSRAAATAACAGLGGQACFAVAAR